MKFPIRIIRTSKLETLKADSRYMVLYREAYLSTFKTSGKPEDVIDEIKAEIANAPPPVPGMNSPVETELKE